MNRAEKINDIIKQLNCADGVNILSYFNRVKLLGVEHIEPECLKIIEHNKIKVNNLLEILYDTKEFNNVNSLLKLGLITNQIITISSVNDGE